MVGRRGCLTWAGAGMTGASPGTGGSHGHERAEWVHAGAWSRPPRAGSRQGLREYWGAQSGQSLGTPLLLNQRVPGEGPALLHEHSVASGVQGSVPGSLKAQGCCPGCMSTQQGPRVAGAAHVGRSRAAMVPSVSVWEWLGISTGWQALLTLSSWFFLEFLSSGPAVAGGPGEGVPSRRSGGGTGWQQDGPQPAAGGGRPGTPRPAHRHRPHLPSPVSTHTHSLTLACAHSHVPSTTGHLRCCDDHASAHTHLWIPHMSSHSLETHAHTML